MIPTTGADPHSWRDPLTAVHTHPNPPTQRHGGVVMARLNVEGDKSIYYEHHAGTGRPVVLVHGWGMSARVWDTVLPALLDAGHPVVALDHRACGSSDKDFEDTSIAAIAADVVALIDHLSLDHPVINGWSLGGAVVAEVAGKLGDQLGGLVLTCGATPRYVQDDDYPHGGTIEALDATMAALAVDRAGFLAGLSAGVCHADVGQPVIDWMWQIFMQASPRADFALRDLGNVDHRAVLPDGDCTGTGDRRRARRHRALRHLPGRRRAPARTATSSSSRGAGTPRSSRRTPATARSSCASPAPI